MDNSWYEQHAALTLQRLLPHLEPQLGGGEDAELFKQRLEAHFLPLFRMLHHLYGSQYDFFYHVESILSAAIAMYRARPADLKALDRKRETDPNWFQSERMMGAVCYVDRFAGSLAGLREKMPYLHELKISYLHLMPLFKCPIERNDGGYAVSSFREVNPRIGTMEELAALARDLRAQGISLVLDFVFNHTADEHEWAQRALSGDVRYQAFYRMYTDRTVPDAYEKTLREIFPEHAPGSFTFRPEIDKWVWTTFFDFQWDLNYENPEVFSAMMQEMLFLANQGVEMLRLDAVPFIWKQLGTSSENLPEAHMIIRAFNAVARIVAPTLLFKSEAIVHPRDVHSYVRPDECQLSYNPILMVSLWEAMATRSVRLLTRTMQKYMPLPAGCAWINYIRSHDDIGWGFADEDAAELGINPFDHRYFLNMFYTGRFPGSFAVGFPFNYNPKTQDMRISGTTASLIGLEQAITQNDPLRVDHAIRRLTLVQGIVLAAGGIPLLFLGDEIGTRNDTSYLSDPALKDDNRWSHRPIMDWERARLREDVESVEGRVYQRLQRLIHLRTSLPVIANGETEFYDVSNPHILAFTRHRRLLVLGNFSDQPQTTNLAELPPHALKRGRLHDLISERALETERITMEPWQLLWLMPQGD